MHNEEHDIELIELYLSGELNGDELSKFETRLQESPDLRKQLEFQKGLAETAALVGVENLRKELDTQFDDYQANLGRSARYSWKNRPLGYLLGGALVIILAGVMITFMSKNKPKTVIQTEDGLMVEEHDGYHELHENIQHTDTHDIHKILPVHDSVIEGVEVYHREIAKPKNSYEVIKSIEIPVAIVQQPEKPTYYFEKGVLWIYGAPQLDFKEVDMRLYNNDIFLFYKNKYFKIVETHALKPLVSETDARKYETLARATGKGPKIRMMVPNIFIEEDASDLKFHVLEVKDLIDPKNTQYKFDKKKAELYLTENLYNKLGDAYEILFAEKTDSYYLHVRDIYYPLRDTQGGFYELAKESSASFLDQFKTRTTAIELRSQSMEDLELMQSY